MCGITGIWQLNGESLPESKLERITDAIKDRGPDGFGYEYFDNHTLGLGHRRLSILDLSESGHQPMSFEDGRFWITYNGEVFNFQEIKTELEKEGYIFNTNTDTEIVVAAYQKWGDKCLNKFNGMWAMAIWDQKEQSLFLARDRFGIKPLYYLYKPGQIFAFSSETKSFKVLDGFTREFNMKMVEITAHSGRIEGSGYSIFKEIFQILPGHCVLIKKGDSEFKQKRWWHIKDNLRKDIPKTREDRAAEYYEIFRDACRLRLVSDVPVGTALSGGLDSSSVYSTVYDILQKEHLTRFSSDSQRAFVVTFPGLLSDERAYAEDALSFISGKAVFMEQKFKDLPSRISEDTVNFDAFEHAPITSISSIYRGMKENGITVSIDGHGVDEMLYGYRDMIYNLFYYFFNGGNINKAKLIKDVLIPTYHAQEQQEAERNLGDLIKSAKTPVQRVKNIIKQWFNNPKYVFEKSAFLNGPGEPYNFEAEKYEDRMLYKETFVDTLPSLFRDFDKAGMMNSVEIRMPFMDWRLVSYTFSLPYESKVGNGFNKLILRDAMKNRMAESIRTRKHKIGISSPVQHWFRTELKDWALDTLSSKRAMESRIFAGKNLVERLEEGYKAKNLSNELIYEAWHEINLQLIK